MISKQASTWAGACIMEGRSGSEKKKEGQSVGCGWLSINFYLSTSLSCVSSSHHKPIKLSLETNNYTHDKKHSMFLYLSFY
jgi:hypothetical protein